MSFETELVASIGDASDAYDVRAIVRRCWYFDFDGYPLRLWHGQGTLISQGNVEWIGTIDARGNNHLSAPSVQDSRDGASPRYEFSIPHVDRATFDALKADQSLVEGRDLTCYHVIVDKAEGLRPQTALRFSYRLVMQGAKFSEKPDQSGGKFTLVRRATVLARSLEFGRSRAPLGTYTDTAQNERARLKGHAEDSFCSFVAGNSRRTYLVGG